MESLAQGTCTILGPGDLDPADACLYRAGSECFSLPF